MGSLRLPELLIILLVLVLVFGANKIPQLGDALGRGIRNFKKTQNDNDDAVDVTPEQAAQNQAQLSQSAKTAQPTAATTAAETKKV
jgi:sec-independent protein translocase protein TatA